MISCDIQDLVRFRYSIVIFTTKILGHGHVIYISMFSIFQYCLLSTLEPEILGDFYVMYIVGNTHVIHMFMFFCSAINFNVKFATKKMGGSLSLPCICLYFLSSINLV